MGVVAYSGYTSSAKKSGAKSNHATVVKYVAAELQKCNIGDSSAMKNKSGTDQLTCSSRKSAGEVSKAAAAALSEFKNAYGFGLRYQLRKGSSENLRLDIGFSPNEPMGIYILFKEAF